MTMYYINQAASLTGAIVLVIIAIALIITAIYQLPKVGLFIGFLGIMFGVIGLFMAGLNMLIGLHNYDPNTGACAIAMLAVGVFSLVLSVLYEKDYINWRTKFIDYADDIINKYMG